MNSLQLYQNRLRTLSNPQLLELELFEIINKHKELFVKANKAQLSVGKNNEGEDLGEYSYATQAIAAKQNPRKPKIAGQPFNFEYTGGLFDGMELRISGTTASFWSTDSKTSMLVSKYDGLFGLTNDNLKEVITTVILPAFILKKRSDLGL